MSQIPREYQAAIRKYGPRLDAVAKRYGISGTALMAKTFKGESRFQIDAVSRAGARGPGQFMPGTRQAVLRASGGRIDPWRSVGEAAQAMVMHMTGKLGHRKGLEGYNPGGGQGYVNYILKQSVGPIGAGNRGGGSSGGGGGADPGTSVTLPGDPASSLDASGALATLIKASEALGVTNPQPTPMDVTPPLSPAKPTTGPTGINITARPHERLKLSQPTVDKPSVGVPAPERPQSSNLLQLLAQGGLPSMTPSDTQSGDLDLTVPGSGGGSGGGGGSAPGRGLGRPGGGFAGTEGIIQPLSRVAKTKFGLSATGKRDRVNTRSGNVSDHYIGNRVATARDFSGSRPQMQRFARYVAQQLGMKGFRAGARSVVRNGYRYQLIWDTSASSPYGDHTDHVHLGIKKV